MLGSIRYFVRVTILRRLADVVKEQDIWVHSYVMPPDGNNSIKMEVGIEDCLHIEFEYNKSRYRFCSQEEGESNIHVLKTLLFELTG